MEHIKRLEIEKLLTTIPSISPTTSLSKVVGILKDQNAYEVLLEIDDKIGMITIRDILKATNITIRKANTLASIVPKLSPRSTIVEAARLMVENHIRVIPIVERHSLIGVIQAFSIIELIVQLQKKN